MKDNDISSVFIRELESPLLLKMIQYQLRSLLVSSETQQFFNLRSPSHSSVPHRHSYLFPFFTVFEILVQICPSVISRQLHQPHA